MAFHLSRGNCHNRRHAGKLIRSRTKTLVGGSHYGGKPLVAELANKGVRVVSNAGKSHSSSDKLLLRRRSLIESVFATLKNRHKLVSSYCRNKAGYLLHYTRSPLGYIRWVDYMDRGWLT